MKTMITLLLTLCTLHSVAQEISGRVLDSKKEPLINASIQVYQGGILKGGNVTDYDGNYSVKPLPPGRYDILVTYTGLDSMRMTEVVVSEGMRTTANFVMPAQTRELKSFVVKTERYKKPLIDRDRPSSYIVTRSEYNTFPTISTHDQVSIAPGVYQQKSSGVTTQFMNPSVESYKKYTENDFMNVKANPLSTMSVDVDRASYSNVRRFINRGLKPPVDAVRVEEMINYFDYEYPQPTGDDPIAIQTELTVCPWEEDHKLLRIGMQARKISTDKLPPSNLVFLIDVSGSMESEERLPLLIAGMKLLVLNLRRIDMVTIVTYAGNAGLVLPPTPGDQKQTIIDALDRLRAGGSTAGGAGIKLAYKIAKENFIKGGNNRVLLATDGDFNVGVSSDNELEDLIVKERASGVYLTCLGFGTDNYKDSKMEVLADKGNGNYDYIDNLMEAQKTLVKEFGGTLFTVAKDVKAQIEFNPAKVQGYRLVGYENRVLNTEDFKDDKKDAGDMGSGHIVTIIYEIIPVGVKSKHMRETSELKYQKPEEINATFSDEFATIKFRYKQPDGNISKEMVHTIADKTIDWVSASENTRFSCSVAMFGMLLKGSKYKGSSSFEDILAMANSSSSFDKEGYRAEFIRLVTDERKLEPRRARR